MQLNGVLDRGAVQLNRLPPTVVRRSVQHSVSTRTQIALNRGSLQIAPLTNGFLHPHDCPNRFHWDPMVDSVSMILAPRGTTLRERKIQVVLMVRRIVQDEQGLPPRISCFKGRD